MDKVQILIVEDEAIIAMVLRNTLEAMGYSAIAEVSTGEEAVSVASQLHPDLVLMDIGLGGEMDGIEAAAQIRGQVDIPVVYVTAYVSGETLGRAELTEPSGYLIKPFDSEMLRAAVERAVQYSTSHILRGASPSVSLSPPEVGQIQSD